MTYSCLRCESLGVVPLIEKGTMIACPTCSGRGHLYKKSSGYRFFIKPSGLFALYKPGQEARGQYRNLAKVNKDTLKLYLDLIHECLKNGHKDLWSIHSELPDLVKLEEAMLENGIITTDEILGGPLKPLENYMSDSNNTWKAFRAVRVRTEEVPTKDKKTKEAEPPEIEEEDTHVKEETIVDSNSLKDNVKRNLNVTKDAALEGMKVGFVSSVNLDIAKNIHARVAPVLPEALQGEAGIKLIAMLLPTIALQIPDMPGFNKMSEENKQRFQTIAAYGIQGASQDATAQLYQHAMPLIRDMVGGYIEAAQKMERGDMGMGALIDNNNLFAEFSDEGNNEYVNVEEDADEQEASSGLPF
jgi:DNA-directed RNA polymerase subunit RPC12/RpoP